jgi:hypothetical protein
MREEERVERLARAIEEMATGGQPEEPDDEELRELLKIARIRMDAAEQAVEAGLATQEAVLERLLARLQANDGGEGDFAGGARVGAGDRADELGSGLEDSDDVNIHEVQEVIGMRRQMAEMAAEIAESHRQAVWQKVQARIQASEGEKRGFFRWPFRRRDREADEFNAALDRMTLGEPIWEAADSRLEELLNVARLRQAALATAGGGFAEQQARVWGHIRPRIMARQMASRRPRVFKPRGFQMPTLADLRLPALPDFQAPPWPRMAAAVAAAAVVLAVFAPLPATGFSDHPVASLARSIMGERTAVIEMTAPANVPPPTQVVQSNDVTVQEASELLGRSVFEPVFLPAGYQQVSSQYFTESMTGDQGGLFVLAYESGAGADAQTLLVYQEPASSVNISVEEGFAQDINLFTTGTPATYISGSWRAVEGAITWGTGDAQTVVFDLNGIRTIIQTSDAQMPLTDLANVASSMAEQATP